MIFTKKLPLVIVLLTTAFSSFADDKNKTDNKSDIVQITQLFEHYMSKYNHFIATEELKRNPSLYDDQVMLITTKGTSNTLSSDAMDKGVTAFLSDLKSKGVRKVDWENIEIKLLADHIALASNVAVRYNQNGNVYNRVGATYFLNKSSEGWRISAFAVHGHDNSIKFSHDS